MTFYDIHTHTIKTDITIDNYVITVLNISPNEFREKHTQCKSVYFSIGIHPWHLQNADEELNMLKNYAKDKSIIAIGEIGLDYLKEDKIYQEFLFRKQIELSEQIKKPIIIHCVKAWDRLISLYKEYSPKSKWIIHGYRGKPAQAEQLYKLGFRFSFGYNYNKETLNAVPLDSMFCETDMKETSICTIYQKISLDLGLDLNIFARKIEENIKSTFFL